MVILTTTKIVLKLFLRFSVFVSLLTLTILFSTEVCAQEFADTNRGFLADTAISPLSDTLLSDTTSMPADSLSDNSEKPKSVVDEPVYYAAADSMHVKIKSQRVLLYGEGEITYQKFELRADFIESDLNSKEIFAKGVEDTSQVYSGRPIFKQGSEEFETDSVFYNLESGKGLIFNVVSEQGEGYLHSDLTKRDNQGHIHVKGGKYTTCDADHPHFYMELTKAIVIPDDKIVSGPAYLVVEDVPIPALGLPFSFFPNSRQRGAGILIPRYGEEQTRGFFLKEGGWYQPLGQYMDILLTGDFYSNLSWAANMRTSYKVRYKFSGNMTFNYAYNLTGAKGDANTEERKDFRWNWTHSQDAKANPTQSFSANVNFSSSGYDKSNSNVTTDYLTGQKSSSINFSKNWPGTPFNLGISANARQNVTDSTLSLDLPTGSFNASTMYPLRKKKGTGKYKWYENIGFSYNSKFASKLQDIKDTLLLEPEVWEQLSAGFSHSIPFIINLKSDKIKMLTISPSLNYEGRVNNFYITKKLSEDVQNPEIVIDTVNKITYAHAVNPGISVGLSPKVYGTFTNNRADPNVIAVRHVMQPRATFSFVPDMSGINPNYYDTLVYVENGEVKRHSYSYYERSLYKAPSSAGKSGNVGLSFGNNVEMKMKPKNDTTGVAEPRKVVLLRNLNASTAYRPFAEQFKWNDVAVNAATSLFNNKFSLNASSKFSFYGLDSLGSKEDEFHYNTTGKPLRFTNLTFSAGLSLKSSKGANEGEGETDDSYIDPNSNIYQDPTNPQYEFVPGYNPSGSYVDFSVPWSLNLDYSWALNRQTTVDKQTRNHTLRVKGDFSLTPNWKLGFNSGYDFEAKEITFTNINIHRDMHCWEMQFTMVPFGPRRNYSFYIRAKSSLLRDLKLDKKQSWYDNF